MVRTDDSTRPVPDLPPWERFHLRYEVDPSFQPSYALSVDYENGQARLQFGAQHRPWEERSEDAQQPPSIDLPPEEVHHLLSLLLRLRITPFAPAKEGLDGVTYSLRIQHGVDSAEFCWWCDLPKGWGGLRPLQKQLEAYCATYFHPPTEWIFE